MVGTILHSDHNHPEGSSVSNTTQTQFGTHTLHSGNLYQIFTYVKNKEAELASQPHEISEQH